MAHFAEVDENNIVTKVLIVGNEVLLDENDVEQESLGIAHLKEWFPDVSKLRIAREVGGLRPWMPDHYPIIGPSSKLQGLWYATGHEGDGINHAPVTAKLICSQMTGQDLGIPGLDTSILLPERLGL